MPFADRVDAGRRLARRLEHENRLACDWFTDHLAAATDHVT